MNVSSVQTLAQLGVHGHAHHAKLLAGAVPATRLAQPTASSATAATSSSAVDTDAAVAAKAPSGRLDVKA